MREAWHFEAAVETAEKRGYNTGLEVRHPLSNPPRSGYIANFVLMEYGTGAISAVRRMTSAT